MADQRTANARHRLSSKHDGNRSRCFPELAQRVRASEEPPETGYVQPGLAEIQFAEALRQLGDLEPAQTYAEEALNTADQCHGRGQVHRYATLVTVLVARGEVEQGADTALQMLDRAQGMESRRIRDRILAVSEAISSRGDSIMALEVSERVKAQFTVPV